MEVKKNNKVCNVFKWSDLFKPTSNKLVKIRPWHNLPKDILIEVMLLVSPYEQFCIRATCKNWWFMLTDHKLSTIKNKIPWMITWHGNSQMLRPQFCLHHPIRDKVPYKIDKLHGSAVQHYEILAIKYGWVLYHKEIRDLTKSTCANHVFLFSPFTERIINLPRPEISFLDFATFSSDPSSPNCVFIAHSFGSEIKISMCNPHDTKWTTVIKKGICNEFLSGVLCIWPFFYVITNVGTIVKCDINGRGKFLVRSPLDRNMSRELERHVHVLEHRREVFFVCLDISRSSWVEDQCHVFKFMWSENIWVPLVSIGERAIFISVTSFLISEIGALKNMAERIYYIDKDRYLKFFCLKNGKSYACEEEEDFEYRGWLADNGKYRFFVEQPDLPRTPFPL